MYKGGSNIKSKSELNKKYFLLIIFLILLIIVFVSLIIYKRQSVSKTLSICTSSVNKSILIEASGNLNPIQSNKLLDVKQKIVKLNKYNQDPNCDYIMMSYYLGYNYTSAQYYYNQLVKYYLPKVGYSPIISGKVLTFSELQSRLNQAKSIDNEIKNNTFFVTGKSK
ncbi:MAG: hypothetical protein WCJ05_02985 [bacterium]